MSDGYDLPSVHFGNASSDKIDWRENMPDESPDDDELHETPPEVLMILGFDPKELDDTVEKQSRFCCDDGSGENRHFTMQQQESCVSDIKDVLGDMKEQVLEQLPHLLDLSEKVEKASGDNGNNDEDAADSAAQTAQIAADAVNLSMARRLTIVQPHTSRIAITAARKAAKSTRQFMDSDTFDQVDENAIKYARTRGAELVTEVTDTTRGRLRKLMLSAVKNGMSASQLRDAVSDDFSFSNVRALMIARTEMAFASTGGAKTGYDLMRDKFDLKMQKSWLLGDKPCEICIANNEQGEIPYEQEFESGDLIPPAHPNCVCDVATKVIS
jgi:hypothetical protein